MTPMSRRQAVQAISAAALTPLGSVLSPSARAQAAAWPKVVTIVVPFPPGGSNDIFARMLAQKLGPRLDSNVVVDNKPGAGGTIGAAHVSRSQPNGATLLLTSSTFTGSAAVQTKVPYDPISGFTPVAQLARGPMILAVGPTSPHKSAAGLIAAAKAEKGKLNYGSAGIGSINHMAAELMSTSAGIELTHIPYKGIAGAITDMMGGRLDAVIASFPSIAGQMKAGKVRGLAVTSSEVSAFAPELAPLSRTVPGYDLELWWGLFAPPQMPAGLLGTLSKHILEIIAEPDMRERFAQEGAIPGKTTPAEFGALVKKDLEVLRKVAAERRISAD